MTLAVLAMLACTEVPLDPPGGRPASPALPVDTVRSDSGTGPDATGDTAPSKSPTADTGSAPAPTCEGWCTCLDTWCAAHPLYTNVADCLARCEDVSEEELACWSDYCVQASQHDEKDRRHLCEHALGLEGLDECF